MRYRQNTKGDILYGPPVTGSNSAWLKFTVRQLTSI